MKEILFVCTGNTCRSPMAEYIMNDLLAERGLDGEYFASSAGVSTMDGLMASSGSLHACSLRGLDISSHRSRQLSEEMLKNSHLILTMGNSHKRIIEIPEVVNGKVFTLGEFAGKCDEGVMVKDISDPYMMDDIVYEKVCEEISAYLEIIINYLKGNKQ